MSSTQFDLTLEQALELSFDEHVALIQALAESLSPNKPDDIEPLETEDLSHLLIPDPIPPSEIIARGLTGTWAHLNITDGAEWVNQQKRKRAERLNQKSPCLAPSAQRG